MTLGKDSNPCVTGHSAYIYDRGGMTRVDQLLDLSQVVWSRDRDGVSEAAITMIGRSCERNRDLINKLITKRHELVIYRGTDRVWEGPLWRVNDGGSTVKIVAKDVTQYLFGTPLTQKWSNAGANATEMTTRFEQIIQYELTHSRMGRTPGGGQVLVPGWEQINPPANILPFLSVHHWPNEARTAATTVPFEMTIGEHLQSAARSSGIDYTAVGRAIHIWDVSRSLGRTRTLTEADFFGNIIVTEYGADHTQASYVISSEGAYGESVNPENLDLYGPWANIHTAYQEEGTDAPTQVELNSQAARNTSGRSPVPFEVRVPDNSSIRLSETLRINDLVPGVQMPLLATLNSRKWNQLQRLDHVTVTEAPGRETIQVTLTPATRPDSDETEED